MRGSRTTQRWTLDGSADGSDRKGAKRQRLLGLSEPRARCPNSAIRPAAWERAGKHNPLEPFLVDQLNSYYHYFTILYYTIQVDPVLSGLRTLGHRLSASKFGRYRGASFGTIILARWDTRKQTGREKVSNSIHLTACYNNASQGRLKKHCRSTRHRERRRTIRPGAIHSRHLTPLFVPTTSPFFSS